MQNPTTHAQLPEGTKGRMTELYISTLSKLTFAEKILLLEILNQDINPSTLLKNAVVGSIHARFPYTATTIRVEDAPVQAAPGEDRYELHEGRYCYVYLDKHNNKYILLSNAGLFPYSMKIECNGVTMTVRPYSFLRNNRISICIDSGKKAVFDLEQRKFLTEAAFDEIKRYSEGYAAARIGNKRGFINLDGIWVIPPQFDGARDFNQKKTCAVYIISQESLIDKGAGKQKHKGNRVQIDTTGRIIEKK